MRPAAWSFVRLENFKAASTAKRPRIFSNFNAIPALLKLKSSKAQSSCAGVFRDSDR